MTAHEKLRTLLFGDGIRNVNMAKLSRQTGIHRNTLDAYRKEPTKIPGLKLVLIRKAVKADRDEVYEALERAVAEVIA